MIKIKKFLHASLGMFLSVTSAHAIDEALPVGPFPEEFYVWPFEEDTVVQTFEYFPTRMAGRLSACSFGFTVWSRDWAYSNNQPFMAVGSINYALHSAISSSVILKLQVLDYEDRDGTAWVRNGDVNFAYFDVDDTSLASSIKKLPSPEEPASYFQAADADTSLLFALMRAEKLEVWFNRKEGGADLQLTIPVVQYREQQSDFYSCAIELLNVARREMESEFLEEQGRGRR